MFLFESKIGSRMDAAAHGRMLLEHCIFLERGWLIERARTRKLREELREARSVLDAYGEHWDNCKPCLTSYCDCGFDKSKRTGMGKS